MNMTTLPHRTLAVLLGGLIIWALCAAVPARAQTVAAMVNGDPITNYDIDQRTKLEVLTTHKQPSRQEVLNLLIDEKVKLKEGKRWGVDPSSADVDSSFTAMGARMRLTPEQLAKSLEAQGIRPETFKARIKADMVWTSLVRGRFKESLQVGEKEVAAAVQASGDEAQNTQAFEYKMQPFVLIVPRGSPSSTVDYRRKEAEALRGRVQTCEEANGIFKSTPNAAIRDLVVKTSADIPPSLRDLLDKTPIGHLTPPEITKQGVEMVALCARNPTTVDTPKKREVREKMYQEKYEAKSKAYLQDVRRAAMIEYR